ncbi:hypothetical protein [Paraflavitalea sp. CAU 1676]|uniref:hypothetical protein n=1 Tax=Paraflavitalea sp. CAU 1676 TaxID=3032598 RepID=UPI0023D9E010|nr:hypothetical protein [Paraflavitalea sp. CAU 1676]MDF2189071.1 hypothetical protein [Paraflavitalea sp. CAU 1676]
MRTLLVITAGVLMVGCAEKHEAKVLRLLENSLQNSEKLIRKENQLIYGHLNRELESAFTGGPSIEWAPTANELRAAASMLNDSLEVAKRQVAEADGKKNTKGPSLLAQEAIIYRHLNFYRSAINNILYHSSHAIAEWQLRYYKQVVRDVDSLFKGSLRMSYALSQGDSLEPLKPGERNLLGNDQVSAALAIGRIELTLGLVERSLASFCMSRTKGYLHCVGVPAIINTLNYERIRTGDTLVLTLGDGEFVAYKTPLIRLDGTLVPQDDAGGFRYSWIASAKPGEYFLPVNIQYEKPTGEVLSWTKNVKYVIQK